MSDINIPSQMIRELSTATQPPSDFSDFSNVEKSKRMFNFLISSKGLFEKEKIIFLHGSDQRQERPLLILDNVVLGLDDINDHNRK